MIAAVLRDHCDCQRDSGDQRDSDGQRCYCNPAIDRAVPLRSAGDGDDDGDDDGIQRISTYLVVTSLRDKRNKKNGASFKHEGGTDNQNSRQRAGRDVACRLSIWHVVCQSHSFPARSTNARFLALICWQLGWAGCCLLHSAIATRRPESFCSSTPQPCRSESPCDRAVEPPVRSHKRCRHLWPERCRSPVGNPPPQVAPEGWQPVA